jgi:TolA-binding protein
VGDTDQINRRDIRRSIVPISSAAAALLVIAPAIALWSGDRSELKANTKAAAKHEAEIVQLQLDNAARVQRESDLQRQLDRMQQTIDRIADRVGAAKR